MIHHPRQRLVQYGRQDAPNRLTEGLTGLNLLETILTEKYEQGLGKGLEQGLSKGHEEGERDMV
jgi:flagellar biosynthesis/type III secretory pathway protein FliH